MNARNINRTIGWLKKYESNYCQTAFVGDDGPKNHEKGICGTTLCIAGLIAYKTVSASMWKKILRDSKGYGVASFDFIPHGAKFLGIPEPLANTLFGSPEEWPTKYFLIYDRGERIEAAIKYLNDIKEAAKYEREKAALERKYKNVVTNIIPYLD